MARIEAVAATALRGFKGRGYDYARLQKLACERGCAICDWLTQSLGACSTRSTTIALRICCHVFGTHIAFCAAIITANTEIGHNGQHSSNQGVCAGECCLASPTARCNIRHIVMHTLIHVVSTADMLQTAAPVRPRPATRRLAQTAVQCTAQPGEWIIRLAPIAVDGWIDR